MLVSRLKYLVAPVTVIALLTSCAGSSTPTTPNALQQNQSHTRPNASCPCLYVTNFDTSNLTVYSAGATGNAKPIQNIEGSNTRLDEPLGVAVDAGGNMYVTNLAYGASPSQYVTVYAAGATGNIAPIQTISGSNTGLNAPDGIAIDPVNGDIYVANTSSVTIYAPGASGNVAPIGTISGSRTGLSAPEGIALDASGNIYVSNVVGPEPITVYAAGAVGNVAPLRTISGKRTKLFAPRQLALDSNLNIYVSNSDCNVPQHRCIKRVTVYAAGAHGDVGPLQTIEGKATKLGDLDGIAVNGSNDIYVADFTQGPRSRVTVYAAGANGNTAPINTIQGSNTGLLGPQGIAIR